MPCCWHSCCCYCRWTAASCGSRPEMLNSHPPAVEAPGCHSRNRPTVQYLQAASATCLVDMGSIAADMPVPYTRLAQQHALLFFQSWQRVACHRAFVSCCTQTLRAGPLPAADLGQVRPRESATMVCQTMAPSSPIIWGQASCPHGPLSLSAAVGVVLLDTSRLAVTRPCTLMCCMCWCCHVPQLGTRCSLAPGAAAPAWWWPRASAPPCWTCTAASPAAGPPGCWRTSAATMMERHDNTQTQ